MRYCMFKLFLIYFINFNNYIKLNNFFLLVMVSCNLYFIPLFLFIPIYYYLLRVLYYINSINIQYIFDISHFFVITAKIFFDFLILFVQINLFKDIYFSDDKKIDL